MLKSVCVVLFAAVVLAGCGEDEASDSSGALQAGGGDSAATIIPPPSPLDSPAAIPDGWETYSNVRIAGFTFRYPDTWYSSQSAGTLTSWDTDALATSDYPPGGIRVDVTRAPLQPPEQLESRPSEATDSLLGGRPGWEVVRLYDTEAEGAAREHVVAADVGSYRFYIIGRFAEQDADESLFLQILSSYEFTE